MQGIRTTIPTSLLTPSRLYSLADWFNLIFLLLVILLLVFLSLSQSCHTFVSSLFKSVMFHLKAFDTTEEQLQREFEEYGPVVSVSGDAPLVCESLVFVYFLSWR